MEGDVNELMVTGIYSILVNSTTIDFNEKSFKKKIKNVFNASDLIFTGSKCHMLLFLVINNT